MLNEVKLIGNLGADPEIRYMPNGDPIANLRVATTRTWKDKAGTRQSETEWHRVVIFGKLAKVCGDYLKKGSKAYFRGRIKQTKYQAQDGSDRYSTDIICDDMIMLDSKGEQSQSRPAQPQDSGSQNQQSAPDDFDDDIPF